MFYLFYLCDGVEVSVVWCVYSTNKHTTSEETNKMQDDDDEEEGGGRGKGETAEHSNHPAYITDMQYARLMWDKKTLRVVDDDIHTQSNHTPTCLDLAGTHSLPLTAFTELSDQKWTWKKLRFNLTDDSVSAWLRSPHRRSDNNNESDVKHISHTVEHLVFCLPGPRGWEEEQPMSNLRRKRDTQLQTKSSQNHHHHHHPRRRRRTPRQAVINDDDDDDGLGTGIEGFLRRQTERFSFQRVLTSWTKRVTSNLDGRRPGPFWWPASKFVMLADHESRLSDILEFFPQLRLVSVELGPNSRSGYKKLDDLLAEISEIRPNVGLKIHYVSKSGKEDAALDIKDCDYELSNNLVRKHEEFEAIRRVDIVSIRCAEWMKWMILMVGNILLWIGILKFLFTILTLGL